MCWALSWFTAASAPGFEGVAKSEHPTHAVARLVQSTRTRCGLRLPSPGGAGQFTCLSRVSSRRRRLPTPVAGRLGAGMPPPVRDWLALTSATFSPCSLQASNTAFWPRVFAARCSAPPVAAAPFVAVHRHPMAILGAPQVMVPVLSRPPRSLHGTFQASASLIRCRSASDAGAGHDRVGVARPRGAWEAITSTATALMIAVSSDAPYTPPADQRDQGQHQYDGHKYLADFIHQFLDRGLGSLGVFHGRMIRAVRLRADGRVRTSRRLRR